MGNGEKINSESSDEANDWLTLLQRTREGDKTQSYEQPDTLKLADEKLERQSEGLSEAQRAEISRLSEDITRIGREEAPLSDHPFCDDRAIASLKELLLPQDLAGADLRIEHYAEDGLARFKLREKRIAAALDYFAIRDDAEARLSKIVAERGESFDEIDAHGIEEMVRILRPQAGDDFRRMQYTASMLADGYPVDAGSPLLHDMYREQRGSRMPQGEKILQARIRDLGNFHILRKKIAETMGRKDIAEMSAVDALTEVDGDSTIQYLRFINPLRLDYDRTGCSDWDDIPQDISDLVDADPTNLCKILLAYNQYDEMSNIAMARNYGPNELLALSDQETENITGFIEHVHERLTDISSDNIRDRLSMLANAIVVCDSTTNDRRSKGGILRNGDGLAAQQYFDCAVDAAANPNDSEEMRIKKIRVMLNMLLSGAAAAGQEEGFRNNLFPAMDAGDGLALSLAEDEFLPDGSPNPDVDKNWTRGFGLGLADYIASCYVRPATPQNIHELIMQHDSLPGLNQEKYFQNREDARALSAEEKGAEDVNIFYSRDFIHNQMPHAHEALVYQWAYQKIGRHEEFSEEEVAMLRQIGHVPPTESLSEDERDALLASLGDEYLDFLEKNGLVDVVVGPPSFNDIEFGEGENANNISEETLHRARRRTIERVSFDLRKYDQEITLLDTGENIQKTERVADVLWRLVKNTDRLTIDAPKTGDAELDEMLAKIDLSVDERGNSPVELRDLRDVMPLINARLRAMQGKREMSPQLIDALSFISRASNYALKDLPKKELRELFYDPTFKEIARFHSLTWQRGTYSEASFEATWRKFSNIKMEDDDNLRIDHYAILNRMILGQSESLVQRHLERSRDERELEAKGRTLGLSPRYDGVMSAGSSPYTRTAVMIEREADNHEHQADMYRNFANSVWSLNLSSTLAKIGYGLAE